MPKKRNKGSGSSQNNSSATRNWGKVKSGGSAFRDHSVPVNTKSRKLHNTNY